MNRIKELRKEANLSQVELAGLLHVSQQAIQQYENGKNYPSAEILLRMSEVFSTSVDYILGYSEIRERYMYYEKGNAVSGNEAYLLHYFRKLSPRRQKLLVELLEDEK